MAKVTVTHGAASPGALGPQLELDGELLDELPEEVGVAVLGELVEDKPVANLGLGEDVVEAFPDVLIVLVANLGARVRGVTGRLGDQGSELLVKTLSLPK